MSGLRTLTAVGCVLASAGVWAKDPGPPGWEAAEKAIAAEFKQDEAAGDKVISISPLNHPELFPWAVRYYGQVLLERKDKTREKHKLWVDFVLVKDRWELQAVGGLEFKALADVKPPPAEEATALLTEAWKGCEGFTLEAVKLKGDPEFQREPGPDRTKARRGYVFELEVSATGTGVAKLSEKGARYLADTRNLLWLDPGTRRWSVDPRAVRCAYQKVKGAELAAEKAAPIAGTEAAAPAAAEAQKAFEVAWARARPDFEVKAVALAKPGELHHSGPKSWVTYKLQLDVVGTDQGPKEWAGKALRCEPEDFSSVLNWSAADKGWLVDEKAIKDVNERGSCVPRK